MAYTFDQIFAVDPETPGNVASNASVLIFAPDDETRTPLPIRTVDGAPMANPVQTNFAGFGGVFIADIERVAWAGGEFSGFFTSYDGMAAQNELTRAAAESAAESAVTAATEAANAAASAQNAAETATDAATAEVQAQMSQAVSDAQNARIAAEQAALLVEAPADEVTAALVGNPESLTGGALSAAYVPHRQRSVAFSPYDFGAIGDGNAANASADTAGLQAALNAARDVTSTFGKGIVRVPAGHLSLNDELLWNAAVPVEGHAQITSVINNSAKFMVRVESTDPGDVASPVRQRATTWSGVILWGDGMTGGITFDGATTSEKLAHLTVRNTVIRNCGVGIYFGQNAYMMSFQACNIQGNRMGIKHSGALNSGERLVFIDCDITGNEDAFDMSTSSQAMHFVTCSFSYNTRTLGTLNNANVYFENCHMEFDEPIESYLSLTMDGGAAYFTDCRWLIGARRKLHNAASMSVNSSGYAATTNPGNVLKVGDQVAVTSSTVPGIPVGTYWAVDISPTQFRFATTSGGSPITSVTAGTVIAAYAGQFPVFYQATERTKVVLDGGHITGSSTMPYLSSGLGTPLISGTQTLNFSELTAHVSDTTQSLMDPGFESTTLQDEWVVTLGADTVATATDQFHSGARSLKITHPTKATAGTIDLFIPIRPGDRTLTSFWHRLSAAGSSFAINWYYANRKKTLGPSLVSSTRTYADSNWAELKQPHTLYRSAPPWAEYLVVRFTVTSLESGTTLHLDDFKVSRY